MIFFYALCPPSSYIVAIISMRHELCILSCDKFKPTLLAALYQWVVVTSKTMDGFVVDVDSSDLPSPESCSQLRKGVLMVSLTLRKKVNSVNKGQKKIIISLADIYSYVILSLKYVMQELSLNNIHVSHVQSIKPVVRPRPNIRSHSVLLLLLLLLTWKYFIKIL